MATLSTYGKHGDLFRILFVAADGTRKTIRLGKVPRRTAEDINRRVEALAQARRAGQALDRQTAGWLEDIGVKLRGKLAAVGLIRPQGQASADLTVAELVRQYIDGRTDVKPGTRTNLEIAGRDLTRFMGDKLVVDATEADAEAFFRHLQAEDGGGLAPNTARRRTGRARQFFAHAMRRRLITSNPFSTSTVKVAVGGNAERQAYIATDTIRTVVDACPDHEWRLIIALTRFAGLRCPSETLALQWADILWDRDRFVVHSPKTEHLEGKDQRVVPIFPELRPFLEDAFERALPGAVHVITRYRDPAQNLRTQFLRIIRRAGLQAWPRLFHNMRASCQTDLAGTFPIHVVCQWLGNSVAVADRHYLQVVEEHFQKAAHKAAQSATGTGLHLVAPGGTQTQETQGVCGSLRLSGSLCDPVQVEEMTPRGSEHLDDSPQETALQRESGTERRHSGPLARVLALVETLSPAERAELMRALTGEVQP